MGKKTKRPAYLPLYVRDFLSDTKVLSLTWIEQVVHLRMLMVSWEHGPLADDPPVVARQIGWDSECGAPDERIRNVWGLCWVLTERGWESPRLEHERRCTAELMEKCSSGGKRGAEKRWGGHSPPNGGDVGVAWQSQAQAQAQAQEEDLSSLRSDTAQRPRRPARKTPEAEQSAFKAIVELWEDAWSQVYDEPYAFQGAKDGASVKRIVGFCRGNLGAVRERVDVLLKHPPDDWYAQRGTLAILASKWNELGLAQANGNGRHE